MLKIITMASVNFSTIILWYRELYTSTNFPWIASINEPKIYIVHSNLCLFCSNIHVIDFSASRTSENERKQNIFKQRTSEVVHALVTTFYLWKI